MIFVDKSWSVLFEYVKKTSHFKNLISFLKNERDEGRFFYPHSKNIFRAFRETPLDEVRVVILGQDPYHGPNQADGLCFSVPDGVALPPSLRNIFKELASDVGGCENKSGSLDGWAKQGVLLLNSILSVSAGKPLSHRGIGWEEFIQDTLEVLWSREQPMAFILWGKSAAERLIGYEEKIPGGRRFLLKSAHPSPLSAHSGFLGSRPFSRVNDFLKENNCPPIEWRRTSSFDSKHGEKQRLNCL
ncbi:uracil-DNA glycosylase [Candidatus Similichlamydia epinepheli]|uniref:uracil-DNA glycosylase n=1 Tax=Candidatus Similichlamydia epinepheli TaxID=1903953 RepID=UPI000D3692E6|nr:uracil-DNA glycosylase [Candidatus Similichlamydia epinepheli]